MEADPEGTTQRRLRIRSALLVAVLVVGDSITPACTRQPSEPAKDTTAQKPAPAEGRQTPAATPISVTGCLQKGSRGTFLVTGINHPAHPDSSNPAVVAHDKQAAAKQTYRLSSGQTRDLPKLVGQRVRVEGTLKNPADAPVPAPGAKTASTKQIKEKDLADVEVSSVQKVANSCGTAKPRARGHAKRS